MATASSEHPERVRTRCRASRLTRRVATPVHLADVEHHRHPLELADRQLAEPVLVEADERADADPAPVERRGLVDDATPARRRAPAEHHHRALRRPRSPVDQREPVAGADHRRGVEGADDDRRPLGVRLELGADERALVAVADDDDPIARTRPVARRLRDRSCTPRTRASGPRRRRRSRTAGAADRRRRGCTIEISVAPSAAPPADTSSAAAAGAGSGARRRTRRRSSTPT